MPLAASAAAPESASDSWARCNGRGLSRSSMAKPPCGPAPGVFRATIGGRLAQQEHCRVTGTIEAPRPPDQATVLGDQFSGGEGSGSVTIAVTRDGDLTKGTTVGYFTRDGTAKAGANYVATVGQA